MTTAHEVTSEMIISLAEWGIKPSNGPDHEAFYQLAIQTALKYFHGLVEQGDSDIDPIDDTTSNKPMVELPENLSDAIVHVLRSEFDSNQIYRLTHDKLEFDQKGVKMKSRDAIGGNAPRFLASRSKEFHLRREFYGFEAKELDSLQRFFSGAVTKAEAFYNSWFNQNAAEGLSFEAIVSSHAVHHAACVACRGQKSLQWTGGQDSSSSWRDMVCKRCGSMYEIKSKKTVEHIKSEMKYNNVRGGSFLTYHRQEHTRRKEVSRDKYRKLAKRYLVLVSRQCTWLPKTKAVWPVKIVEIDYVVPKLKDRSFVSRKGYMSIGTNIRLKVSTLKSWFQVPIVKFDIEKITQNMYDDYFGSNERMRLKEKWESGSMHFEIVASHNLTQTTTKPNVGEMQVKHGSQQLPVDQPSTATTSEEVVGLRKELEKLTLNLDNWEDTLLDKNKKPTESEVQKGPEKTQQQIVAWQEDTLWIVAKKQSRKHETVRAATRQGP